MRKLKIVSCFLAFLLLAGVFAQPVAYAMSQKYNISVDGEYIKGIPEKVTHEELIESMPLANASFVGETGKFVGTGDVIDLASVLFVVVIKGDVDGSGSVDTTDYLKIKSYCLGTAKLENEYFDAADVDESGVVDATDYLRIKSHFLGLFYLYEDSFKEEETSEESSEESSEEVSADIVEGGTIHFTQTDVTVTGDGVSASGTTVVITSAGTYTVTGTCGDGYIIVRAGEEDNVKLKFAGVSLTSLQNGPIFFESAKNGHIILEGGTKNTIADSSVYTNLSKAAIFAECDLKIKGSGSLEVTGNFKHAIASDDEIFIENGNVTVKNAMNDGFHSNDGIYLSGGNIAVKSAGSDAFESELGVEITGGSFAADVVGEGIKAGTYFTMSEGTVNVISADNGIKALESVLISGGDVEIKCTGNGIKSDKYIQISGGTTNIISSMGDGIKASDGITVGQGDVEIIGGKVTIIAKYDGIQADGNLFIDNGYDSTTSENEENNVIVSENVALKGSYVVSGGSVVTDEIYSDPDWNADSEGFGKGAMNDGNWVDYTAGDWVEVKRANGGVTVDFKLQNPANIRNVVLNMGMREGSSNRGLPDSVTVYTSADGANYSNVFGSISGSAFSLYSNYGYSATVSGMASNVNYVRIFMASSTLSNYVMRIGEIEIYNGDIPSGTDAVVPSGYNITITTNGGASNKVSVNDTQSYKGIKGNTITIKNCNMYINASDDAIHSNGNLTITGGKITVGSGDDGIHAENDLTINGGEVEVTQSNEGIEGLNIYIGGTAFVKVKASDDGFNAAGGADGSGGRPGMSVGGNYSLNFSGDCFVYVNAAGDGLDSNGSLNVSGGKIFCEGPTSGGNSSIDHNGTMKITGGILLSLGSAGMANECLSNATSSTQCAFAVSANGTAGTTIAIKDTSGTVICVFKTQKQFQHVVFSSSGLSVGKTYQILTGATGVGDNICGYYPSNQCNGGTQIASVNQSSTVVNSSGMGGGGMRPPRF